MVKLPNGRAPRYRIVTGKQLKEGWVLRTGQLTEKRSYQRPVVMDDHTWRVHDPSCPCDPCIMFNGPELAEAEDRRIKRHTS